MRWAQQGAKSGYDMGTKRSNVFEIGDKLKVRATLASRRGAQRREISAPDAGLTPPTFPLAEANTSPLAIILQWGAFGAIWGGLFGLGFSMVLAPLTVLGWGFMASIGPMIALGTLAAAFGVAITAMIICVGVASVLRP